MEALIRLLRGRGPEESACNNDFLAKTGSANFPETSEQLYYSIALNYCTATPTDLDMNHSHQDRVQKEYENCPPFNRGEVRIAFDQ